MGRYVNGEWVPDGQMSLSDHGFGDVFAAIPGGRHHIVDLFPKGTEFNPVDPAGCDRCGFLVDLPCFGHYWRGWYDE